MTTAQDIARALEEYREDGEMISVDVARAIASQWHGGQWSPLYSFASTGTIADGLLYEIEGDCLYGNPDAVDLKALRDFISQPITSVESSHGHRFMATSDATETCMVCGALYELWPIPNDPTTGRYTNHRGDAPNPCTGDTHMCHGYPNERVCDECDSWDEEGCEHCNHICDCLLCDS